MDSTVDEPEDALAWAGMAGAVDAADAPVCRGPSCRPCGGGSSGQANIMAVLTAEASSGRACAEFAAACAREAFALPPAAACNRSAACMWEKPLHDIFVKDAHGKHVNIHKHCTPSPAEPAALQER